MTIDFLIGAVRASDLHPLVKTELEEILNRQEPVKPINTRRTIPITIGLKYECICGAPLLEGQPFCSKCGKAMKWE